MVQLRAGKRCEYCGLPDNTDVAFHVDHITAQKHGGSDKAENLAYACSHCNLFKGSDLTSLDPSTTTIVALHNPRTDDWDSNFQLIDGTIFGLTPCGRATVELLRFNDDLRVELRRELIRNGTW